jgi:hypothetical protein
MISVRSRMCWVTGGSGTLRVMLDRVEGKLLDLRGGWGMRMV